MNEVVLWCVLENSTMVLTRLVPISGPCSVLSLTGLRTQVGQSRLAPYLAGRDVHPGGTSPAPLRAQPSPQARQCPSYSPVLTARWPMRSQPCWHGKHLDLKPTDRHISGRLLQLWVETSSTCFRVSLGRSSWKTEQNTYSVQPSVGK